MSNEIQVRDDFERGLSDLIKIQDVCAKLTTTPLYKKVGAEGVFAIVSYARMLNMNPLEALNGDLYYEPRSGKVGMSAQRMCRYIREAGHTLSKSDKSTVDCVILTCKKKTGEVYTTSFSIEDAKRAQLIKGDGAWTKYPTDMCFNRAVTRMFRQFCPELAKGGGYTKEELESIHSNPEMAFDLEIHPEDKNPEDIKRITKEQAKDIYNIMKECSQEYRQKIIDGLRSNNLEGYDDMTPEMLEKLMPLALSERMRYQGFLVEQEMLMVNNAVVEEVTEGVEV